MSKISIEGNASGTGTFTIASPNSNTNRTLNLPDAAGTFVVSGTTPSLNGVTFPASQVASADANTLDDYEEGTWTPTYFGASTAGTSTYTQQTGIYTKVGRLVTVTGRVGVSAATGTGQLRIGGLPFTCNSTLGAYTAPMVIDVNWGGGTYLILVAIVGETNCEVFYCADDAAIVNQSVTNESQNWAFTFTYMV